MQFLCLRYLFERWLANFDFFSKLRTVVYPPNMALIGAKLWENAFQAICKFSFFDAEKFFWTKILSRGFVFFKKLAFWRSYEFLSVTGRSVVKSYCPNCLYFWGDFLGEGVNDSKCVETLDLAPKMTSTIWCCDQIFAGQFLFSRNWRFGGARQVWASLARSS